MFAKKQLSAPSLVPAYRKELEHLYERRSAINTLIESLEEYDRFRVIRTDESERQTA